MSFFLLPQALKHTTICRSKNQEHNICGRYKIMNFHRSQQCNRITFSYNNFLKSLIIASVMFKSFRVYTGILKSELLNAQQ